MQKLTSHISLISNYYASITQLRNFVVGLMFQYFLPQLFTKVHSIFAEIFINESTCILYFFLTLNNYLLIFKSKQSTNNCPWTWISFIIISIFSTFSHSMTVIDFNFILNTWQITDKIQSYIIITTDVEKNIYTYKIYNENQWCLKYVHIHIFPQKVKKELNIFSFCQMRVQYNLGDENWAYLSLFNSLKFYTVSIYSTIYTKLKTIEIYWTKTQTTFFKALMKTKKRSGTSLLGLPHFLHDFLKNISLAIFYYWLAS